MGRFNYHIEIIIKPLNRKPTNKELDKLTDILMDYFNPLMPMASEKEVIIQEK